VLRHTKKKKKNKKKNQKPKTKNQTKPTIKQQVKYAIRGHVQRQLVGTDCQGTLIAQLCVAIMDVEERTFGSTDFLFLRSDLQHLRRRNQAVSNLHRHFLLSLTILSMYSLEAKQCLYQVTAA